MVINNVDEYIDQFPPDVQNILKEIRKVIVKAAPEAQESISYGVVGYKLRGKVLIYFGGFPDHVSIYPRTQRLEREYREELTAYISGKGTIKFPLTEPIPYDLIKRIAEFRIIEIGEDR